MAFWVGETTPKERDRVHQAWTDAWYSWALFPLDTSMLPLDTYLFPLDTSRFPLETFRISVPSQDLSVHS